MKVDYNNPRVVDALKAAPPNIRKSFKNKSGCLPGISGIPWLQAKKYDVAQDLWQARVTKDWRFYFVIEK